MKVDYLNEADEIVSWCSHSGYSAEFKVPMSARNVVVRFEVATPFGRAVVWEVDRSKKDMPWVNPSCQEMFVYDIPIDTKFILRGTSRRCYVSHEGPL